MATKLMLKFTVERKDQINSINNNNCTSRKINTTGGTNIILHAKCSSQ